MQGWTNDERMMITCCNDGTRLVIFKIERIDTPENEEERQWIERQNFKNTAEDATIDNSQVLDADAWYPEVIDIICEFLNGK